MGKQAGNGAAAGRKAAFGSLLSNYAQVWRQSMKGKMEWLLE
jgi:hypothetical protein